MARLSLPAWVNSRLLTRWIPDSLFGRLALLLMAVALISHVLALSMMFEFRQMHPHVDMHMDPRMLSNGPPPPHPGPPGGPPMEGLLVDLAVRLGAVLLAAWVAARWLSAPMRRLAEATRELAQNIHRAPIVEAGTRECREATGVINQLQQHICAQLAERDLFVAAVSHDLRTPLTRLALRVQSLESDAARQQFGRDIAEMDSMIRATLDHLSGNADAEPWVELDVLALVQAQVHDNQDCGFAVRLADDSTAAQGLPPIRGQLSALRRCIANLIENAVRYGGSAEIQVCQEGRSLCVRVCDRGPGIPAESLRQVLLPFYRVETSRNRHTGGVGLGLATANDIARRHGGSLTLTNREGGGLQAELVFPLKN